MSKWKPMAGMRVKLLWVLRKEAGLTQTALANACIDGFCISQADVSNIEGKRHPTVNPMKLDAALKHFSKVLGYEGDPHDLLEEVRVGEGVLAYGRAGKRSLS